MSQQTDFEEVIPGTRRLFDENGNTLPGDEHLLKHGDIVLVPQPTESPNDPLNWSNARKIWHSFLVLFVVGLTAATSNNAGSGADGVGEEFGIGYDVFNTGAGVLFIGIGYWCFLSSPAVHLYGRRLLYLIGMLFLVFGDVWYARLDSVADTVWCQLFVGASESVAEAVVQLSLLDIWFEHQNGTSLGMYTLATAIGTYLGPLVGNYVAGNLGWRWIGWLGALFGGGTFILLYFGLEETEFQRDRYLINRGDQYLVDGAPVHEKTMQHASDGGDADAEKIAANHENSTTSSDEHKDGMVQDSGDKEKHPTREERLPSEVMRHRLSASYSKPKTYLERIRLITPAPNLQGFGFKQFVNRLWHTMRVFTFPAVWYAGLQWGGQNIILTFQLTVCDDNWYGPPWNYGNHAVGNMNIPCLIGSIIGCFYGGWCSDKFMIYMTKRNKGVMEAEYRLYLMFLCMAIFPIGVWLFGIGSARGWAWPGPYVGLGFIGFGYGCAGDLSITYLADSYPDMILEGMVGVATINNTIALIFTFTASAWLATSLENCFIELGVLSFLILGSSLPMIIWGKKWRRWTRGRYMKFLEIRDGFSK
ncbi:Major facilitator superfamily transporter [Knufia obscura]|uniref:Major facilitator super transporter n=2 Tax=Knufia TaxID=430999 RepID=A0AAN8EI16_9EURO|nr:Major facilitator superfamily transporter [Knufia obscura]KAK5956354.1 Major facilitator super transporter [Knufia fluminis]